MNPDKAMAGLHAADELRALFLLLAQGSGALAGALPPATNQAAAAGEAPLTLLQLLAEMRILLLCRLNMRSLARVAATCSELYRDKLVADEPRLMTPVEEALRQRSAARGHVCPDRLAEDFSS